VGGCAHNHRVRRCQPFEPSGDVGRLTSDGVRLTGLAPAHLARNHQTGVNADPYAQLDAVRLDELSIERPDALHDAEARAHRPPRVVLVGLRVAEIHQQAVPDVFGDVALEAAGDVGAGLLVGAQHLAQVLRIELARQLGRAHQIDEHHGQLPPLRDLRRLDSSCSVVLRRSRGRRLFAEQGDCGEELLSVAERFDPELLEIVIAQRAQALPVDGILGERLRILLKPMLGEPSTDVDHSRNPRSFRA
jgi:hypothetical protein